MEMRVREKMPQHCSWFDVRAALARLTAKFKGEEEQDDNVDLHDEKNYDEAVRQSMWNGQSRRMKPTRRIKLCQVRKYIKLLYTIIHIVAQTYYPSASVVKALPCWIPCSLFPIPPFELRRSYARAACPQRPQGLRRSEACLGALVGHREGNSN